MIKICVLDSIENEDLVLKSGHEKVLIPVTKAELNYYTALLNEGNPILLEVEMDEKRLIETHEQLNYSGELENPALVECENAEDLEDGSL